MGSPQAKIKAWDVLTRADNGERRRRCIKVELSFSFVRTLTHVGIVYGGGSEGA